ncbi:MAG: molybdenum cofactor biosynthesis protein MoaE [Polyangiaceae bacterium]|jgi:molybdopterin synthase catalytic subunit
MARGAIMKAELRRAPLGVDEVVAAVEHAGAGAIDVFVGVVRDTSDGRPVTRLDYEAYATMAEAEMVRIGEEIQREISGVRVAVLHRIGSLAVGETAVVCAASAPHRAEAFLACRTLIDRIKARVPIWKREHGPDGSAWVGWVDARCGVEDEHGEHHANAHSHAHGSARDQ